MQERLMLGGNARRHHSRRIRDLEARLGAALFIRSPGGVQLTQAGMQFVERGRKALSEIGLAKAVATKVGRGEDGHVRIGIFSSLASGFLSDLIESFGTRHATVKLTFIDDNPAEHVAAIRKHQLDVAFITGAADWPGCDGQQLWTERIYVVLPTGHRLGGEGEVDFAELAGEPFIVSESAPGEEIRFDRDERSDNGRAISGRLVSANHRRSPTILRGLVASQH